MTYQKIKSHQMTEEELRSLWISTYCDTETPIYTFDSIQVKFHADMFDHAFYESQNRKKRDKSILSLNRCQKMLWIKDTLQDPTAILKQGWDRENKKYMKNRRVAIVKNNYVVIIQLFNRNSARFISAYEMSEPVNLMKIFTSPNWNSNDLERSGIK